MIAIINRGPVSDDSDDTRRRYIIQVNTKPIATFEHDRSDGLAVCLRKAALAVEKWERKTLLDIALNSE